MSPIRLNKSNPFFLILVVLVYVLLTIVSLNNCYFWDNIQQISKEAHWFYLTDFNSIIMPSQGSGSEIVATGYHPPLMGIMTAALWKIFGYRLWVSHIFVLCWSIILIYNVWKLIRLFFAEKFAGWVVLIVMLEPTVLTQFSIASPDFILFTAFVISLRALLEHKPRLLSIGLFFLCCINMRGIFAGGILFFIYGYFEYGNKNKDIRSISLVKFLLPYLPTLLLLIAYFTYYFITRGWFFSDSYGSDHYSLPTGLLRVIRHLAEFGLRTIENGRFFIWLLGFYITYQTLKSKSILTHQTKTILLFFILLTGLYFLFVFISQMPFSARYFMPQFFMLTILVLSGVTRFLQKNKTVLIFLLVLCFELTGHFWIYPEKIAKSWDCTLAHLPYYELRKECFNYIDQQKLNYNDISAGFCFYGNRQYIELSHAGKRVGTEPNRKYFIYSNISNVEDSLVVALKNQPNWIPIKRFEKGFVFIEIYKNSLFKNKTEP